MHELSLALEVIDLAQRETVARGITAISELVIEVGDLSGVEADAFQSALELVTLGSILETAAIRLVRTPGTGTCAACNITFAMKNPVDTCPQCRCFPSEIKGGKEFRVVSMLAD